MAWAIGGMIIGLLLGGVVIAYYIFTKLGNGVSQAFGWPTKPWWKFWR